MNTGKIAPQNVFLLGHRFHPTITVDGCELRCAARGTEMYSGKPTLVDEILATKAPAKPLVLIAASPQKPKVVGCACGSGIPVQTVSIEGQPVQLLAVPLIFSNLRERGRAPEMAADELMASVEIYNAVPVGAKAAYRTAILREYAAFCRGGMR